MALYWFRNLVRTQTNSGLLSEEQNLMHLSGFEHQSLH